MKFDVALTARIERLHVEQRRLNRSVSKADIPDFPLTGLSDEECVQHLLREHKRNLRTLWEREREKEMEKRGSM